MTRVLYAVPVAHDDPKYQQVAADLRARMEAGEYPPGTRLPSITKLMERYDVALATMNAAIRVLRAEGRVETEQGKGTFARQAPDGEPSEEYRAIMGRVEEIAEEVRQLRGEVAALKRAAAR